MAKDCILKMQGTTLERSFAAWQQYSQLKAGMRDKATSAQMSMQLCRKRTVLAAWRAVQTRAAERALMSKALAHMRQTVVPATFQPWRHHAREKHSLRDLAKAATLRLQKLKKRATLTAWCAAQHKIERKRELLRKAVALFRHAAMPAAFWAWQQHACKTRSLRVMAVSAVLRMQNVKKHAAFAGWHAGQQRANRKREMLRKAVAFFQNIVLPVAFKTWQQQAHMKHSVRCFNLRRQNARRHGVLRGWHAAQQRAAYKTEMLCIAAAFFRNAVLPMSFHVWHQGSHERTSKQVRAKTAVVKMHQRKKQALFRSWVRAALKAQRKREMMRKAIAHLQHAVLPATLRAWAEQAAWLAYARSRIAHCFQVNFQSRPRFKCARPAFYEVYRGQIL